MNSGAPEGLAVPAQLVAPAVLLLLQSSVRSHEGGKYQIVITTNGTYPWSFVTHIFRNG